MKQKTKTCKECGNIYVKDITWRTRIFRKFKLMAIVFICITSLMGSLAIYNLVITSTYDNPDLLFTLGGFWATFSNIESSFLSEEENIFLKEIALNITKDCKDDDYCKTKEIYYYIIENFDYNEDNETSNILNPIKTLERGNGDCDQVSFLMISLLKSIDITAILQANHNHAWAIIKLKNPKINIKADITKYIWEEF